MNWYTYSREKILQHFQTDTSGLSKEVAHTRLITNGPNALPEAKTLSLPGIFLRQFKSPLIYLLLASTGAVLLLGEYLDALVIALVLFVNAVIGAFQEGRAQNALLALRNLVSLESVVIREGKELVIQSSDIVPGDILIVREGDKVTADARIIYTESLILDESALTGESLPVSKTADTLLREDMTQGDQVNMLWSGTYVVSGFGTAVVVATGQATSMGAISSELEDLDTDLPLKTRIKKLSQIILGIVLISGVILLILGLGSGMELKEILATVVAVVVSVTPEGLPIVVTLVLAAGVSRMSKKHALVKNLQAVEALGQAHVIAVDKTGTITLNQMMVCAFRTSQGSYEVTGEGYNPEGSVLQNGSRVNHFDYPDIVSFATSLSLTSGAHFGFSQEAGMWQRISGDPTEVACSVFGAKLGFSREVLLRDHVKVFEEPFTSDNRYHALVYEREGDHELFVAGAPETVLEMMMLSDSERETYRKDVEEMSQQGLRVIMFASKKITHEEKKAPVMKGLSYVGSAGIADTIRASVAQAVASAHGAGMKVVMITGDYATTAKALASQVGIYKEGDSIVTGEQILAWGTDELARHMKNVSVFARVAPEHKMEIIKAYRKAGLIVAMTGDGVNDALPLAAADLGVSMGKIGTEVAKEASDIVLLDDDFGNIVLAIEEGRAIYQTIKKVVLYLLSTSLAELLVIIIAMLAGFEIPLSATQILWLNFVTDGFLVAALALEKKEPGLLNRLWTARDQRMLDTYSVMRLGLMAGVMVAGTLIIFSMAPHGFVYASTMALTVLAAYQWFNAFNCATGKGSLLRRRSLSNPYLLGSLAVVIALHMVIVYVPVFQHIFDTRALAGRDMLIAIVVALTIIVSDECFKGIARLMKRSVIAR